MQSKKQLESPIAKHNSVVGTVLSFFSYIFKNVHNRCTTFKKEKNRGAWVAQSVKHLTSTQVMIS